MKQNILLLPVGHMRINLRGADRTVPQHLLNIADINILLQQERGERVPEHMGCDMLFQVGQLCIVVDHEPDGLVGQLMCQPVDKEITADLDIIPKCLIVQP